MPKKWKFRPIDRGLVHTIIRDRSVAPVVAQILANRSIVSPEHLASFFDTRLSALRPPQQLPGVSAAVAVIHDAIIKRQKIVIYGDYDCDGMTATAILYKAIKQLNGDVSYFVPNRIDDGYGLNIEQIRKLKEKNTDLIVTVDCGIASVTEAAEAARLGITLVITDHHLLGPVLPTAAAIVHPQLPGSNYPFDGLCGAGVAFKLAWALFQYHAQSEKLPEPLRAVLFQALGLAAIGTICDVVPLVDENRILVFHGLKLLKRVPGMGLHYLMTHCKLQDRQELTAEDVAFGLGPRLNAAGRLGQAQLGVELLIIEQATRAEQLAEYIDNLNKSRDSLERGMLREAQKMLQTDFDPVREPALVLANPTWHQGVIGIVAGRLAEKYQRPTIIIRNDPLSEQPAVGSARSACGLHLYDALAECRQHLVGFGGHAAAAGLRIECEAIPAFREEFCDVVSRRIAPQDRVAELTIDAEVALSEIDRHTVRAIDSLAPFGQGNPRPILCVSDVGLCSEPQTMGGDGRHLALRIEQSEVQMRCVAFGQAADWLPLLHREQRFDFAFKPVINDFGGYERVELQLVDFRPTQSSVSLTAKHVTPEVTS